MRVAFGYRSGKPSSHSAYCPPVVRRDYQNNRPSQRQALRHRIIWQVARACSQDHCVKSLCPNIHSHHTTTMQRTAKNCGVSGWPSGAKRVVSRPVLTIASRIQYATVLHVCCRLNTVIPSYLTNILAPQRYRLGCDSRSLSNRRNHTGCIDLILIAGVDERSRHESL
jgi:hypothetical protein